MAATLTDELTRVSVADIEKWEEDGDTLYVYGKCTTPEVDTDDQVVDSPWSGKALREYLDTAPTVRVQHNAQRDPAGSAVRVDVNRDGDGAHWLKAAVDEPVAQRLVKKGHLRAFSVGISRPVIERDVTGKARGGIIKGGKIVEVSLVDSPANRSCFLELSKADKNGACEFTGKLAADDDFLQKALGDDLLTKDASGTVDKSVAPAEPAAMDSWQPPADLDISFTPNDLMKIVQGKIIDRHYDELALKAVVEAERPVYKRDIDTATRRRLAGEGNALPNLSYPIENAGDLDNAARLARTGHGDVAAARRLIARRARELGVANPLDEGDSEKVTKSSNEGETGVGLTAMPLAPAAEKAGDVPVPTPFAAKEAEPELTKDPEPEAEPKDRPVKKAKKPKKSAKKLPPWLNKPADDGDADDDDKSDKAAHCTEAHEHTEKCHTPPSVAAGVTATHMDPAPVGELLESDPVPSTVSKGATPASASGAIAPPMDPVPAHREPDGSPMEAFEASAKMSDGDDEAPTRLEAEMKVADLSPDPEVAAIMRFKAAGIEDGLGRLHDLTCPAYHPDAVAKYHPFADFANAIDLDGFQRQAMKAAAGGDLSHAKAMQEVLYAAAALKTADAGFLNDCRLALHKAFRDANPGPNSAPTPGSICASSFNRPLVTEGHEASSAGHDGPNTSPQVANSAPNAHSFDRPPLAAGHQSPSPSHMKASFEYPAEQGVPTRLNYATMEKERARQALVTVHEHLSRQFPEACPISLDGPQQPTSRPVPPTAGIGKAIDPVPAPVAVEQPEAAFKATPEDGDLFSDADIYKSFKKMRKKLGKKVLSGKMTVDEARSRLGRQFAQKGSDEEAETVQKSVAGMPMGAHSLPQPVAAQPVPHDAVLPAPVAASFDPELVKAVGELKDLLVKQQETFETKLAEQQRVIDAIADQPDPSTAAFSGLAFKTPVQKSVRPAGVTEVADAAARAQSMIRRNLENIYYTHSSPARREAAGEELAKLGMETPMT